MNSYPQNKTVFHPLPVLALLLAAVTVRATLVSENFDRYGTNNNISLAGLAGGTGWPAGSTWAATGTPPYYDGGVNLFYFATGYTNGPTADSFTGSAFNNGSTALGGSDYVKRLFTTNSFTTNTTLWVSALTAYSTTGASTAAYLMFNTAGMRLGVQAGRMAVMNSGGTIVTTAPNTAATGTTHLLIFEINFVAGGNDTIQGWLDPTNVTSVSALGTPTVAYTGNLLGSTLADDVEISLRGTVSTDYVSMDRVRLSYGGSASLAQVAGGP